MPYMIAVSLEMSDEPNIFLQTSVFDDLEPLTFR